MLKKILITTAIVLVFANFVGGYFYKKNKENEEYAKLARIYCRTVLMNQIKYEGKTDYGRPPVVDYGWSKAVLTWPKQGAEGDEIVCTSEKEGGVTITINGQIVVSSI